MFEQLERLRALCRVCLRRRGVLNIFTGTTTEKFLACTNLRMIKNDGLPETLCSKCSSSLDNAFTFHEQCIVSDVKLKKLLDHTFFLYKIEVNDENQQESHDLFNQEQLQINNAVSLLNGPLPNEGAQTELDDVKNVKHEDEDLKESKIKGHVSVEYIEGTGETFLMFEEHLDSHLEDNFSDDVSVASAEINIFPISCKASETNEISDNNEHTYKCEICHNEISGKERIKRHKRYHKPPLLCDFCGEIIYGSRDARTHVSRHLKTKNIDAKDNKFCQRKDALKPKQINCNMNLDLQSKGNISALGNADLQHDFSSNKHVRNYKEKKRQTILQHFEPNQNNTGEEIDSYECDICQKTINGIKQIKRHKRYHKESILLCEHCGKTVYGSTNIAAHKIKHLENGPMCHICHKRFSSIYSFRDHLRTHGIGDSFQCDRCQKKFSSRMSITAHIRTHTKKKPYVCKFCGKRFNIAKSKLEHERLHTGERPYKCPMCNKGFVQCGNMKKHFLHNHPDKDFCEIMKSRKKIVFPCDD